MSRLQEKRAAAGSGGGGAAADAKADEGFFKAYLETILGNLQLSITNVHIRFEGELPAAGAGGAAARFAAGITLQELSAITTDASGSEAFEAKVCIGCACTCNMHTAEPALLRQGLASRLHKSATLKRLAIYYDPSARACVGCWRTLPCC